MALENLMKTTMESLREMIDVNTVIGDPIQTLEGSIIIPVSRVACGFGAGGGEFKMSFDNSSNNKDSNDNNDNKKPSFGGGSGGGISVQPVGFLVVGQGQVRLLPVDSRALYDRILDMVPQLLDKVKSMCDKESQSSF